MTDEKKPGTPTGEPKQSRSGIDFETFVLSLSSSAMYHLGLIPNPDTNLPERNLPLARQTIDIMAMLQEKTRGNLSQREDKMLEALLYDLRVKCVDAAKATR